jgi:hypothetical protein
MRHLVAIPFCLALTLAAAAPAMAASPIAGDGLRISTDRIDDGDDWSPWQARFALSAPALPLLGTPTSPSSVNALLAGDRYFGWGRLGDGGGLRATGALLLGPGALSLAAPAGVSHGEMLWRGSGSPGLTDPDAPGAVPYLGLGYSAWWAKSGIGVSADLGLAAQRPGQAVRFGRVMQGGESLDDMLRAMQISPVLQVNLSYAF